MPSPELLGYMKKRTEAECSSLCALPLYGHIYPDKEEYGN
jgi:hypothetical protein